MRIATNLIIVLLLFAGIILLQIFLSKKESRWPGLVLPAISFLFGFLYPLNMIAPPDAAVTELAVSVLAVWLLGNIPTFILLAIYFGCHEKYRRKKHLDKMNIQDLS